MNGQPPYGPRRRHRCCSTAVSRQYLGTYHPRPRPGAPIPGQEGPHRCDPGDYRRTAPAGGLHQGPGPGRGCRAVSNAAIQAIGCLGMRACHTNNCPVGIATQREDLRARLIVEQAAKRLQRFLDASVELMAILARACGHASLQGFNINDLTSFDRDMAYLTGIRYGGVGELNLGG